MPPSRLKAWSDVILLDFSYICPTFMLSIAFWCLIKFIFGGPLWHPPYLRAWLLIETPSIIGLRATVCYFSYIQKLSCWNISNELCPEQGSTIQQLSSKFYIAIKSISQMCWQFLYMSKEYDDDIILLAWIYVLPFNLIFNSDLY